MLPNEIREKLAQVETTLRGLREERGRAVKLRESAKAAYVKEADSGNEESPVYVAAKGAVDAVQEIDAKIAAASEEQTALLRQIGDMEAGMPGFTTPGLDGWGEIARQLDLDRGETRVDVPLGSLLAAGSFTAPPSGASSVSTIRVPMIEKVRDNRFLFPRCRQLRSIRACLGWWTSSRPAHAT